MINRHIAIIRNTEGQMISGTEIEELITFIFGPCKKGALAKSPG